MLEYFSQLRFIHVKVVAQLSGWLVGTFLFCSVFQWSICVVKACHYQNKSLSILFPVGTI